MRIKRITRSLTHIEDFADKHELTMVVVERDVDLSVILPRLYASFENTELINDGLLIRAYGNGDTEKEAIDDYASRISNRIIVVNAYRENRHKIVVPEVI